MFQFQDWMPFIMKYFLLVLLVIFTLTLNSTSSTASTLLCPANMVLIPGGTFEMGSDRSGLIEEKKIAGVKVNSFCIDIYEVTNADFANFVQETGYITIAERPLSQKEFPHLSLEARKPGSLVFQSVREGLKPVAYMSWWHWIQGANWRHPYGPESDILERKKYPVVHIAYPDALAYAQWVGKELPTEAQWEYAARGGLKSAYYSWGNLYSPSKANTWQGSFPVLNTQIDGYLETSPVGAFPPNGYGLYDMIGNVWEWTHDFYQVERDPLAYQNNPQGPNFGYDPKKRLSIASHVIKGGSHLCAPNYCSRYRPAARESQSPDTGTTHIGFRLVKNIEM
ncbi:MAG: formylglycine-generating enzyme family protein [Prochloraceae cyanobacterium]